MERRGEKKKAQGPRLSLDYVYFLNQIKRIEKKKGHLLSCGFKLGGIARPEKKKVRGEGREKGEKRRKGGACAQASLLFSKLHRAKTPPGRRRRRRGGGGGRSCHDLPTPYRINID